MAKAVFYDRDGLIIQMAYDHEHGTIDTVRRIEQIEFVPGIIELLQYTHKLGFLNIIVSSQPGIGLGKISMKNFDEISKTITDKLKSQNAVIDAAYYCFHHPYAKVEEFRSDCDCRKPKAGLLFQAAKEHDIKLDQAWMIGDGVNDILAGHNAGCKTILLGNPLESEYLRILKLQLNKIRPDFIVKKLSEVEKIIKN